MADGNPLGPQPDFNIISDELKKAQNLPAIANGQLILEELRAIRREIAIVRQDVAYVRQDVVNVRQDVVNVRQDVVNVRQDITHLDQKFTRLINVSNHNNTAQVQNTYLTSQSEPLSLFLDPSTGAAIPEFPTTSMALEQMTGRQMNTVLQQLGLHPADGASVAAKKKMLRCHIGLREVAAQRPP
ncbi:hypothetical protein PV10_00070 [Exophiala mesophila]|uniref:Uncharacterized protein n=1 Tax=Exophiala mesophila TaxID=212818 RepID=A0A0D1ZQC3_EXOME|nr:uncharacterized protein PV10_00070 [Exophiala mesophila]KIV96169.1 hypothetical protein PV10_00070 [Exophiala mesophila]